MIKINCFYNAVRTSHFLPPPGCQPWRALSNILHQNLVNQTTARRSNHISLFNRFALTTGGPVSDVFAPLMVANILIKKAVPVGVGIKKGTMRFLFFFACGCSNGKPLYNLTVLILRSQNKPEAAFNFVGRCVFPDYPYAGNSGCFSH